MTQLLERAFREAQKLSSDEQDALAQRILSELSDDRRWSEQFDQTTDEQWEKLARQARETIKSGDSATW